MNPEPMTAPPRAETPAPRNGARYVTERATDSPVVPVFGPTSAETWLVSMARKRQRVHDIVRRADRRKWRNGVEITATQDEVEE